MLSMFKLLTQSLTMSKRKRTAFDLQTKLNIIECVNSGEKKTKVAEKFSIALSTLSTILKNKEKIYDAVANANFSVKSKRMRAANNEELEIQLLEWFKNVRHSNIPVSGPLIKEKASIFANNLGIDSFKCSDGWLYRFQQRHGISSLVICGDSAKVNEEDVNVWRETFKSIKKNYSPKDIFNMDESGIFYNLLPQRTLDFKGKKCHGGAQSKQRVTAVFACNSDGSEKLPVWIIGKAKNPRCFKNIDFSKLNCLYTNQSNSWVDTPAFRKWVLELNDRMVKQRRHILLTLDNCSAHDIEDLHCSHIKFQFFPPNTTSTVQPLDQGIIKVVKSYFKQKLVRAAIQTIENTNEKKWNLLDAIRAIIQSWESVSSQTIQKCFEKAWNRTDDSLASFLEIEISENTCPEWEYLQLIDAQVQVNNQN